MYKIIKDEAEISASLPFIEKYAELRFPSVRLSFVKRSGNGYAVECKGKDITIFAERKSDFFAAITHVCAKSKEKNYRISRTPVFSRLGLSLDAARNGVPTVEGLKREIVNLALLGYDYLEIYVEDCFEVTDEPLFGYMRGKYTKAELKEVNSFASSFGVELVPCIQTLAHLERIFQHYEEYFFTCRDINDILLADEPRTYRLIENMLKTCAECFSSRRINVGMDEAFLLGAGEFNRRHGYENRLSIFVRHARKVFSLCEKYGFQPSMWGDMIFRSGYGSENENKVEYADLFKRVTPIYWAYSPLSEETIGKIKKLREEFDEISFAGGAWKWVGFAPCNEFSIGCISESMQLCKETRITDYLLTTWGDNGSEAAYRSVYASVAHAAAVCWGYEEEKQSVCSALYGYSFDELLALDLPNKLYREGKARYVNPSKYLLYIDGLQGVRELKAKPSFTAYYVEYAEILRKLSKRKSSCAYLFETAYRLCEVLALKATLHIDILKAYNANDRAALKKATARIDKILPRLNAFYEAFRSQWDIENKPQGFEVQDARLGGLAQRLAHIKEILKSYLSGKISSIAALDERGEEAEVTVSDYDAIQGFNSYAQNITYGSF